MLPLVQMHHMVQPQLDYAGPHQGHMKPDYSSHYHGSHLSHPTSPLQNTNSTPRAFAIRSNQHVPGLHRITTTFTRLHAHDQAEHSLRRKTPNGTIDNGYDGSLTHLASGPPPLKHMIVPASSNIFPTAVVQRVPTQPVGGLLQQQQQQPRPVGTWPYHATTPTSKFDLGTEAPGSSPQTPRGWGIAPPNPLLDSGTGDGANFLQPATQQNHHGVPGLQPLLGPEYHQPLSQTVCSPYGYQQSAVWSDGGVGYRTSIPLANGYTPQNSVDGAFMPSQTTIHTGLANPPGLGQPGNFDLRLPSHQPLEDGFTSYARNRNQWAATHAAHRNSLFMQPPTAGYLAKAASAGDAGTSARFRDRALQNGHKAYNDLLFYLTNAKKASHGRRGSGVRPSHKMVVYPKPSTSPTGTGSKVRPFPSPLEPLANYTQQLAQKEAVARAFLMSQGVNGHRHHHRQYHEGNNLVVLARASLGMLSNLCEQSGWKWVEGMLLGGCLHYGLEHYEEALEWFKRIVNLDAK